MRYTTTPWVRAALAADPMEAMALTALCAEYEGTLHLWARSAKGPFGAIYHAPGDDSFDGSRGTGRTLRAAVERAVGGRKVA